jgi:hypothetical protein
MRALGMVIGVELNKYERMSSNRTGLSNVVKAAVDKFAPYVATQAVEFTVVPLITMSV